MITDFQGVLLLEFLGLQPVLKPLAKLQYRAHLKKPILRKPILDYQDAETKNSIFDFFKWTQ